MVSSRHFVNSVGGGAVQRDGSLDFTWFEQASAVRSGFRKLTLFTLLVAGMALCLAPNAMALPTGQISGTVTSASGKAPLKGIEVCASLPGEEFEGEVCETTDAAGEYTITKLPSGEYHVEFYVPFESGLNYITEYYNDKLRSSEAQLVTVTEPGTTTGIERGTRRRRERHRQSHRRFDRLAACGRSRVRGPGKHRELPRRVRDHEAKRRILDSGPAERHLQSGFPRRRICNPVLQRQGLAVHG
jgi:hypothetical protein